MMDLSIIIVNYNVYSDVLKCIESIYKFTNNISFEIVVIDNGSDDKAIYEINKVFKDAKFIPLDSNTGFAYANNIGMKAAQGRYFLLVNPDIIFTDNSIKIMYDFLENNDKAGVAGPVQTKPNEGIEYYYTFFPSIYSRLMQENRMYMKAKLMRERFFTFLDSNIKEGKPFKVDWVIGSCMMVRREIFETIGGFDEAFFLFEEETEWQHRMRQNGWQTYIHPGANVIHNHHSSVSKHGKVFGFYHEFRSRIIFDRKRFKGFCYTLRFLMIETGLSLRVIYFSVRSLFNSSSRVKLKAYFDLLKFNSMSRNMILASRYDYTSKKKLFT